MGKGARHECECQMSKDYKWMVLDNVGCWMVLDSVGCWMVPDGCRMAQSRAGH